jgi:hypothetical protein
MVGVIGNLRYTMRLNEREVGMSTLEILDNGNKGKILKARIDADDYTRLKDYTYVVDKTSERPYREETIGGKTRRLFLVRDVMRLTFGDNRVVYSKSKDPLDCRKDNLEEGKIRVSTQLKGKGAFWPHTFKSLLNFLASKDGDDEIVVHDYLSKAYEVKYTRKMIALTYASDDYRDFQTKKIFITIRKVLNSYFDWAGTINPIKDATLDYKKALEKKQKELKEEPKAEPKEASKENSSKEPEAPIMIQRVFSDLRNAKEREKIQEESKGIITYAQIKQDLQTFLEYDPDNAVKLLKDPRIFTLESFFKVFNDRVPMSLQFSSK